MRRHARAAVAGWGWWAHRERVEDRREAVDLAKLIIGLQTKMMERNRAPDQPDLHTLVLDAVEERAEQRRNGLRQHRGAARPAARGWAVISSRRILPAAPGVKRR